MTDSQTYLTVKDMVGADDNLRVQLEDIEDLADSIAANGILTPLLVTTNGSDKYKVVAGHRRLAAVNLLIEGGKAAADFPIPVLIREGMDDPVRVQAMVVENVQRQDLNPIEEGEGYRRLSEFGLTTHEIATQVGRNQSHVSRRMSLLRLHIPLQRMVIKGTLTAETATLLARLENQDNAALLVDQYGPDISENRIERAIKEEKTSAALAKLINKATAAGLPIITRAELTKDYSFVDDGEFTDVSKAKAFMASDAWGGEDWFFVGAVTMDMKPSLRVYRPTPAKSSEQKAQDKQKQAERIERITSKLRTQALVAIVAKPTKTKVYDTLAAAFAAHELSHSNAGQVCKYLDLEPLTRVEKVRDYATGEVKDKITKDYVETVRDWASQSDKQALQVLTAIMVVKYAWSDEVKQFLADAGMPTDEELKTQATEDAG